MDVKMNGCKIKKLFSKRFKNVCQNCIGINENDSQKLTRPDGNVNIDLVKMTKNHRLL